MNKTITTIIIAMVGLMGLVNASLLSANNLTISNISAQGMGCYSSGQQWDHLGSWKDIFDALQISGVMRVHDIPAGYHISDNIPLGGHCYVYEVGITKGHAYPVKWDYNKGLEWVYTCSHGGKQSVKFASDDGGIIAEGWVKGDPQYNSDCSGE
ncbi:hypothetical protein F5883DRAFT_643334 [Diaporthe sp. PMI_573]|nr:hypothetical protein F5883DRAFT_643334 [Diaporthaceae sp. PMI_573]